MQTCSATQTTFDTTLKSYTGTAVNALTNVAANDDACANTTPDAFASLITFTVVAGTPYRIQVDGFRNETGTFLLAWNFVPPNVVISNVTNGNETGPVNGVMTVTQSAVSATNTVIAYSVSGTATSGIDYTALSGTVTILAGATTATITIPVINDVIIEPAETAIVTLTSVTSGVATLGATLTATNTITSDDAGTVSIANTTNAAEPGTNGVLTVTQTLASATNTVLAYTTSGTATSGIDYTALSGTVTIPAGATSATISIPVIDDAIVESGETVIVTLTGVTSGLVTLGAPLTATNTITDNDVASVTIANTTNTAEPATNGVLTVTQSAISATNTVVAYSTGGTATSGTDFAALSGTVTVLAGAMSATISIPVLDDAIVEGGETVILTLTSVTSGLATLGATLSATNTIADNDVGTIVIADIDNAATEAAGNTGAFTVALGFQPSVSVTVTIGTSPQCTYAPTTLTFTTANWNLAQTVTVTPVDDAIVEGPHTCSPATISAAGGAYAGVTGTPPTTIITDNDTATVSVANTTNASEPATNGTLTVTQTSVSATNTVVSYSIGGTATSGTDYTALSGTVTIPAGATTATISIPVLDDVTVEAGETVGITLTTITSGLATLGTPLTATNTIADNDNAVVTIANTTNGSETGPTNGVMTLTQSLASSQNTVIAYSISGTATSGSDYSALSGNVTIPAGTTTATISILVIDDLIVDPSETLIVSLTSITSGLATLGATVVATNTIGDNDIASFSILKSVDTASISAPATLTYTISVSNTGNVPLTGLTISDTLLQGGAPRTLSSGPTFSSGDTNSNSVFDASETWLYVASYAVSQSDIDNGTTFSNTATFDSIETPASTSGVAATTITQTKSISLTKSANVASVNYPGDPIVYSVTVTNTGNVTTTSIVVSDTLATLSCPTSGTSNIATLPPAASEICTVIYPAAQVHFDTNGGGDGDIDNIASATGTASGTPVAASGSAAVILTPIALLTLDKTADTAGPVMVGQVVNYTYTVTNSGNVTISGVNVSETAFNGNGTPVPSPLPTGPTTLAPGQTTTFVASYIVTQDDIDLLQ